MRFDEQYITEEELLSRIKNAIILLTEGRSIRVGELYFGCAENILSVSGESSIHNLATVTKQSALSDIADIKKLFSKMVATSKDLSEFIKHKQVTYKVFAENICICQEINGQITFSL